MYEQRLSNAPYTEVHPTFKLVGDYVPRDLARAIRDNPDILRTMVRAGLARLDLCDQVFMRIDDQVRFWEVINRDYGWGLSNGDLHNAAHEVYGDKTEWNKNQLPVIVPYLPDKDGISGTRRTFDALRALAKRNFKHWLSEFDIDAVDTTLTVPEEAHEPGYRYECIQWSISESIISGVRLNHGLRPVHAGGLACAVLHPEWLRQHSCIQHVELLGYAVNGRRLRGECVPAMSYYETDGSGYDTVKFNLRLRQPRS